MDQSIVEQAYRMAAEAAKRHRIDLKSGVRRVLGTGEWRHDPERQAAAEAKRARKNARRAACR